MYDTSAVGFAIGSAVYLSACCVLLKNAIDIRHSAHDYMMNVHNEHVIMKAEISRLKHDVIVLQELHAVSAKSD